MSWKTISVIGERLRFAKAALKAQKPFAQLCLGYGISRVVGYKWLKRFVEEGRRGLRDQSRRPRGSPRRLAPRWLKRLRQIRRPRRRWGGRKIVAHGRRLYPRTRPPTSRTVDRWLSRLRLTRRSRRRGLPGPSLVRAGLTPAKRTNQVWTADFKGWFRTQDGHRVEPLTVRDLWSRFVLPVQLLPDQSWWRAQRVFRRLFRRYGLPRIIRVDNGGPFASKGPAGLSRLSAWWTGLGIQVEFTRPGHPQDNGAHEQFHAVLKAETLRAPSRTVRAQQRRTVAWVKEYNFVRPHQGLQDRTPGELYRRSPRAYRAQGWILNYPRRWSVRRVRSNGQIKWQGRKRFIGEAFVRDSVGLKPIGTSQWAVYFGSMLLGHLRASDSGGLRPAAYVRQSPIFPQPKV